MDGCSFSSMQNDTPNCQNYTEIHNMIRWKSGKRVDPRVLTVLELFGEVYVERRSLFKKIFHGEYEELFKTIGDALKRKKQMKAARGMTRSVSMRAMGRTRGTIEDKNNGPRLQRFKIKTPDVIVAGPDDTGPGGQTRPTKGSSQDSK